MTVQQANGHHRSRAAAIIVVVETGLKPGQKVVVAGQLKLSNGTKVNVVDGQTLPEMTNVPMQ